MYTLPGRALHEIPVLETARLRLRPAMVDDFHAAYAMWQNENYVKFIGNRKRASGEVWGALQRSIGSWAMFGFGYLTITDKNTDAYMGECGFALSRRGEITPALPMIPEAGWGIAPKYWNAGYCTEAMTAIMDWALSNDPQFPAQCIIDPGHLASEKIAYTLGFRFSRTVSTEGGIINFYQRGPVGLFN